MPEFFNPPATGRSCWMVSAVAGATPAAIREIDVAAAVSGKPAFLGVNDIAELRAFGLNLHGVGDDFNVFGDGADVEYYIVFQLVVYCT